MAKSALRRNRTLPRPSLAGSCVRPAAQPHITRHCRLASPRPRGLLLPRPCRYKDIPSYTYVSGLHDEFPPPPPREVTDEEMIELGLMERPPKPPEPAQPAMNAQGGIDPAALGNVDPAALAQLLQALAQSQGQAK